jgi:hypothetical protein
VIADGLQRVVGVGHDGKLRIGQVVVEIVGFGDGDELIAVADADQHGDFEIFEFEGESGGVGEVRDHLREPRH